ncbi:MAG: hypothetical protein RL885_27680 [Planctomycetota bacterium]
MIRTLAKWMLLFSSAIGLGCQEEPGAQDSVPGRPGGLKSAGWVRAERRAFDGAPPVIPHRRFGPPCLTCHNDRGIDVAGVGFAPANPHARTEGLSDRSRCEQCHVFRHSEEVWTPSDFTGLRQTLANSRSAYQGAPPVIPHRVFMRENCFACHTGPAAREAIRCTHPERVRCQQCHVPVTTNDRFLQE